jgi:NAD+ synthase (glutamine-hydrolysing)
MDLRVAAAQLDVVVGDLEGNARRIVDALRRSEELGADICVFPELAITGYPPEDLLLKARFVADNLDALSQVAAATRRCVAVVGFVEERASVDAPGTDPSTGAEARDPGWHPRVPRLANAAALCVDGRVAGVYRKRLLPNYSVFDEQRWFTPGDEPPVLYRIGGVTVGVSICEDVWADGGPVAALGAAGAQVVVNLNASPYSRGRRAERLGMLADRAREAGCPIVYVNQVGGQDELVFDGASLIVGADGSLLAAGAQFAEDLVVVDVGVTDRPLRSGAVVEVSGARPGAVPPLGPPPVPEPLEPVAEVYEALVLGTHDYLAKNGFTGAVIGLSGGIDSSIVATIAADALGPAHVHGVSMPSRYSSEGSRTDAEIVADRLGIDLEVVPIEAAHSCLSEVLTTALGEGPAGLTDENLQSRLRGVVLMAISNATGWIVLTTGNKSEMATGYSTLYGDSAGGFAVIKDVPKTLVYELCRYRNGRAAAEGRPQPVPPSVLDKPPSAELRPDQRDDQSLPAYELLDPVLEAYVERDRTAADLVADGFDPSVVDRVVRLVDGAEYKRRQMAPGVRITNKAFGRDRRMPITNRYRPPVVAVSIPTAAGKDGRVGPGIGSDDLGGRAAPGSGAPDESGPPTTLAHAGG